MAELRIARCWPSVCGPQEEFPWVRVIGQLSNIDFLTDLDGTEI